MASQTTTQKEKEEVKVRHGPDSRLSPTSTAFMRLNHDNMSSSHRLRTASVHHKTPTVQEQDHDEDAPLHILMTTYLGYGILILFGHLRDFFGKIFKKQEYAAYQEHDGYAPLISGFDSFYTRRMYMRIRDCWNRPSTGVPSRTIHLLERESLDYNKKFKLTGHVVEHLNMSSYNYLGFAQKEGPCADDAEVTTRQLGLGVGSARAEVGTMAIHHEVEKLVAQFVGTEDSVVVSMGFATNSTTIPALVSKGCLLISDELNHASLVFGARLSQADIRVFPHNDMAALEQLLRTSIAQGQPRTHRPWKKILVVVEGLYSMEGNACHLRDLVALRNKYKFYLYVDEAHSVGALGPRGRGVCDYFGVNPRDVDILMGTFTKSFGAAGGYIAASKAVCDHLRQYNHGSCYSEPMPPVVAQQTLTSMRIIMGDDKREDGNVRLQSILENAIALRNGFQKMGFIVYGWQTMPVIPLLLFNPAKIAAFSRECKARGLAVVVVGYPATPVIASRARFCVSASHTRRDVMRTLEVVSEVGDLLGLKVSSKRPRRCAKDLGTFDDLLTLA